MSKTNPNPLNSLQLDILNLFSRNLDEQDLLEIKRIIVRYLADKATRLADEDWDQKGLTAVDMEDRLKQHYRTPY